LCEIESKKRVAIASWILIGIVTMVVGMNIAEGINPAISAF
jgi:hypothetical protein